MLKKSDLSPEQQDTITRLVEHDETLLLAKLGFGKAIVGMTALQELLELEDSFNRAVVFAPLQVCELTWGPEAQKWEHITVPVHVATGPREKRLRVCEAWERDGGIVVVNFENIGWFTDYFTADLMLIDEISKMKAAGGAAVKALRHWVKNVPWRAGMSGSSVAESGADIYAQALLLDLGKRLGTRKDRFERRYFEPENPHSTHSRMLLRPGAAGELADALGDLLYIPDEASYTASLPEVNDQYLLLPFDPRMAPIYQAMERDGVWGEVVAENQAVRKNKLAQIAAGLLYDNDGNLAWFNQPRHEWVVKTIRNCPEPVVVVYQYTAEIDYYSNAIPHCLVMGNGNKVTPAALEAWNRGEVPVLFMHPKSAAHGLNLQYGSRVILHLSPLWGADPWAQCLGRVRRRGQPADMVTRMILATEDTVDMEMLERLEMKMNEETELMGSFIDAAAGAA